MSLINNIKINSLSEAQEILKAAGEEDLFEKAHKDGDMHPNGKWVWVSSAAGGKGDWRTLNGRTHKKHQSATASAGGSGSAGNGGKSSTTQSSTAKTASTKQTVTKVKPIKDYFDEIKSALSFKGFDAHLSANGSIEVYEKGKRKSMKNLKASIQSADYIDFGSNTNLKDKITSAVKEAIDEKNKEGKASSSINPTFQKYFSISNSKFTDPKKMSVSKTSQGNWSLSYDGKRISTVAPLTDADKKKLESAGVTFDDTFKPKQKVNAKSETYSHKVNGVTITVSKNKDGSYTLEANGKKVKSDDPSFFKDKLTLRVKNALAKEVGIDSTKKISTTKKIPAGKRVGFDDDVVAVYDAKGKKIYYGIFDYCPYKNDNYKWNDADKNYDLPNGYKMVGK